MQRYQRYSVIVGLMRLEHLHRLGSCSELGQQVAQTVLGHLLPTSFELLHQGRVLGRRAAGAG